MSDPIYHMVHYREFSHDDKARASETLESLIRASLNATNSDGFARWESIEERLLPLNNGTGMDLVLNRVADLTTAVFGEMCLIHQNAMLTLLEMNAKKQKLSAVTMAEIYSLTEATAPKGSQYVKGLTYFIAIGNHLFFIRNQSLTYQHIEIYLAWLIEIGPKGLSNGPPSFQSKFDKSAYAGDIGDIRALRVHGPSFPQMAIAPATPAKTKERNTTRKIADKFVQFEQAYNVAKALLGPAKAEELASSLGPKERLVVDATVKVKGTRTDESKAKLAEIAKEMDALTDGKVGIEGKDGTITDADVILRTKMPFSPAADGSALLDFFGVSDQLQLVYKRFVEDKKIKA